MEEKILETFITAFIKELISEGKDLFDDIYDEAKQLLGKEIKQYLVKQKDKYSHIKTLLRGNSPVFLYDIYFPLKLIKGKDYVPQNRHFQVEYEKNKIVTTDSSKKLFAKNKYMIIIGDAGSGKSTLVKHLFLNSIKEKIGLPILIELRYLNNEEQRIEDYIVSKIFEDEISQNHEILERLLRKGKFVFFLDGYDELNAEIKTKVIQDLNVFVNKYGENKFILTTRPYSNIEHLPLFHNFVMKNLSDEEINQFIQLQLKNEHELSEKIIKSLEENKSEYIQEFLTNPLLLSLYILTFQSNSEIPNKKYIFYRRVINALFSEHDSKTKLGYVREKLSKLNQEQFEEILKAYSFLSYFESKFNFDKDYVISKLQLIKKKMPHINFSNNNFIYDLKSAIALWVEDYGMISFAHRSIQEYFAALFVKNLNLQDKEKAYHKILSKQAVSENIREVENFLSICEEMDTIYFYKFYGLPILREMRNHFEECQSDVKLVGAFIRFFIDKIPESLHSIVHERHFSKIFNKSVYYNLPFIQGLFSRMQDLQTDLSHMKSYDFYKK